MSHSPRDTHLPLAAVALGALGWLAAAWYVATHAFHDGCLHGEGGGPCSTTAKSILLTQAALPTVVVAIAALRRSRAAATGVFGEALGLVILFPIWAVVVGFVVI